MQFNEFCEMMYTENCIERRNINQDIVDNLSEYILQNQQFLLDKFSQMCDSDYTLSVKEIVA